ncbi:hypothetical protein [Kitasatospora sp. CB01950]|uniref:hypothetical protein n=1 Tax=Kitasatospora sp. CB01950 TaxID=1703930 RepID=UPI0013015B56|nr:hypothetical protein [Kitasatospora sp. CB01950]
MNTRTYRNPSHHLIGPGLVALGPVPLASGTDALTAVAATPDAELAARHAESTAGLS